MATLSDAISYARTQAQTDSNGLTNAKGIQFANEALLDFVNEFISRGVDAAQLQESYTDAVANTGTYLYPTNMWFLKAIEINFSDTSSTNYLVAEQVDQSNIPAGKSFSWLRVNQNKQFPLFADNGDWFEIFPTPTAAMNLSQAIRIIYFLEPTEYTSVNDTISYPLSLDYRILGWRIASSYLKSLGNWESAVPFDEQYATKMNKLVKTLSRGTQQPTSAVPIMDSGWTY